MPEHHGSNIDEEGFRHAEAGTARAQYIDDSGLLTCKQCKVRYAWAADYIALKVERDALCEAVRDLIAAYMADGDLSQAVGRLEDFTGGQQS